MSDLKIIRQKSEYILLWSDNKSKIKIIVYNYEELLF